MSTKRALTALAGAILLALASGDLLAQGGHPRGRRFEAKIRRLQYEVWRLRQALLHPETLQGDEKNHRAVLGVVLEPVSGDVSILLGLKPGEAVRVVSVQREEAREAGLKERDVISKFQTPFGNWVPATMAILPHIYLPGDTAVMEVFRRMERMEIRLQTTCVCGRGEGCAFLSPVAGTETPFATLKEDEELANAPEPEPEPEPEPKPTLKCPECGRMVPAEYGYCPFDGARLRGRRDPPPEPPKEVEPPPPPPPPVPQIDPWIELARRLKDALRRIDARDSRGRLVHKEIPAYEDSEGTRRAGNLEHDEWVLVLQKGEFLTKLRRRSDGSVVWIHPRYLRMPTEEEMEAFRETRRDREADLALRQQVFEVNPRVKRIAEMLLNSFYNNSQDLRGKESLLRFQNLGLDAIPAALNLLTRMDHEEDKDILAAKMVTDTLERMVEGRWFVKIEHPYDVHGTLDEKWESVVEWKKIWMERQE